MLTQARTPPLGHALFSRNSGACSRVVLCCVGPGRSVLLPPTHAAPPVRIFELRGQLVTEVLNTTTQAGLAGSSNDDDVASNPSRGVSQTPSRTADLLTSVQKSLVVPIQELFIPDGYPVSVTPDYLPYQLWTVPVHILGGLSKSLATSALLKAVGMDAGPATAAATGAAIKWITKDGLGAAGRFLVGTGRWGQELDDDPRRMRMLAELLTTVGLALEVTTAFKPAYFLYLASAGNFLKALARGLGNPAFRVIQNHFAAAGNVGSVSAKEQVWEVAAELAGLAVSVAALQALQSAGPSWVPVLGLWVLTQGGHVALRYYALSVLQFNTLSTKRAAMLVRYHVAGRPLPNVPDANAQEPMLMSSAEYVRDLRLGCTAAEAFGSVSRSDSSPTSVSGAASRALASPSGSSGSSSSGNSSLEFGDVSARLAAYVDLYSEEEHVLVWDRADSVGPSGSGGAAAGKEGAGGAKVFVLLKEGCRTRGLLRALWQWAWLEHQTSAPVSSSSSNSGSGGHSASTAAGYNSSSSSSNSSAAHDSSATSGGSDGNSSTAALLAASLRALDQHFDSFVSEAEGLGWDLQTLQIMTGVTRIRVSH